MFIFSYHAPFFKHGGKDGNNTEFDSDFLVGTITFEKPIHEIFKYFAISAIYIYV